MLRAVVLAAGKGTRMRSDLPKVLHEVAGMPMVARIAEALKGIPATYVVGYGAADVKRVLPGARFALQVPQRGTGHAVLCAGRALRGHRGILLVLPGDAPLVRRETLHRLAQACRTGAACAVLTTRLDDPSGYGRIVRDPSSPRQVTAIVEEANAGPDTRRLREVNSGIYAFDTGVLWPALKSLRPSPPKGEVYLTDVVAALAREGRAVEAVEAADPTDALGINTPWELAAASALMRRRIVENLMASGVAVEDPASTWIETEVPIGEGTVLHPFTVIRRGVRIGRNCRVGPFAHLREGTVLEDGAEIGDFVEAKKARLGKGAKAKHLAYLGDVSIGKRANIGAGAVVANYDGKAKHPTSVGEGAFIGSGAVLVAPVRIGRRAVVGAGAVVTSGRNVRDGAVVVGVPASAIRKRPAKRGG